MISRRALACALIVSPAFLGAPALAQDQVETGASNDGGIVVTAQRRSERAVDVPISITAIGTDQIENSNIENLTDISVVTPALRFDYAGNFVQPTIRGVGTPITTSGGGTNVGIYVDGFLNPNPVSSTFDLTKVEGIQVLKGPQGTLFGRNTTGGAIIVTTAEPSTEFSASGKLSYARFNEVKAQGYTTFGLADNVAVDLEGLYTSGDGYYTDILTDNDKIGKFENWTFRGGLKVDFSPDISLLLRYIHTDTDDPTFGLQNAFLDENGNALVFSFVPPSLYASEPGDVALSSDFPIRFKGTTDAYQATLKADLGFADAVYYGQYRKDSSISDLDLDATALNVFNIGIDIENETWTHEVLLTSKPGGRLQWTAGAFSFWNVDEFLNRFAIFTPDYTMTSNTSTTTKSLAAFADLTYEVTDRLFLTVGGRFSHETISDAFFRALGSNTVVPVPDFTTDRFTPRVVVRYETSPDSSVYASFTKGFKAGILNVGGYSTVPIQPEDMNAYEIGFKHDTRAFGFSTAAYYYDYSDLQVSSFQNGAAQIRNAASSHIWGVEADMRWSPVVGLTVTAGAAYTKAEYDSFPNAPFIVYCDNAVPELVCGGFGPGTFTQVERDASGQPTQRAPEFTANLGANYQFDLAGGTGNVGGNFYYTSKFYFDPSAQFSEDGYGLLSLRASWTDPSDTFTVGVFGDNVTGERYITGGNFSTLAIAAGWSAPATYGAFVGFDF